MMKTKQNLQDFAVNNTSAGIGTDISRLSGAKPSTAPVGASASEFHAPANSGIESFGTVAPNQTEMDSSSAQHSGAMGGA